VEVARVDEVWENAATGERFVWRATAQSTGGELASFDAIGRPSAFGTQEHVHPNQTESYEVIAGALGLIVAGQRRVLGPGDRGVVPPGVPHRLFAPGDGEAHVRFELRPALRLEAFLERYVELGHAGQIRRSGMPRLLPGAAVARDFEAEGHATWPPLAVQRVVLGPLAWLHRRIATMPAEYVFLDEWDVDAPIEAVFDALADARSYPAWWRPVYLEVETDGPPEVGQTARHLFKGRLPYHLRATSTLAGLDRPNELVTDVHGDLSGRGRWTLTWHGGRTHVRFDWRVSADRPLLRVLTPLLRPLFRWNHAWAVARAVEGLEPYARRTSAA
jgi:mannose-6-phosphate isomerase-like protein (cupin superfamily)